MVTKMLKPKKKQVKIIQEKTLVEEIKIKTVEIPPIGLLSVDYGREDLNILRDKINELINRENAKVS